MNVYQVEQIVLLPLLVCFYNGMNLNLWLIFKKTILSTNLSVYSTIYCVLIQKFTWNICNVFPLYRRILLINLLYKSKKIWDCLQVLAIMYLPSMTVISW
jgi:hypothetical protein